MLCVTYHVVKHLSIIKADYSCSSLTTTHTTTSIEDHQFK